MPIPIQPAEGRLAFLRMLVAPVGSRVVVAVGRPGRAASTPGCGGPSRRTATTRRRPPPRPNLATAVRRASHPDRADPRRDLGRPLGLDRSVIHDRFFDLGGHSLLAVQVASEIRDRFQIEMPVLKMFKAPTIAELAALVDEAELDGAWTTPVPDDRSPPVERPPDDSGRSMGPVTRPKPATASSTTTSRGGSTAPASAGFVLPQLRLRQRRNGDEADVEVRRGAQPQLGPPGARARRAPPSSTGVRSSTSGAVAVAQSRCSPNASAPWPPASTSRLRQSPSAGARIATPRSRFEVGDAEHLPVDDDSFDVVTNLESSHTYPDMRAFLGEVRACCGPVAGSSTPTCFRPALDRGERALLDLLGFEVVDDREITPNVLASCDEVAAAGTGPSESRASDRQLPGSTGIAGLRADGIRGVGVPDPASPPDVTMSGALCFGQVLATEMSSTWIQVSRLWPRGQRTPRAACWRRCSR